MRSWPSVLAELMKPCSPIFSPATASNNVAPRVRPGQASCLSKSANVAFVDAKVLVSCKNPPTAIRAINFSKKGGVRLN